jgi:cephalosporin hydroxylase
MPDLKDIPDSVRWRYAAECAAKLPALYEIAFREALGPKFAVLEQDIWMEIARIARDIVHTSSFPVGNAQEIARAIQNATIILFGPEYGGETIDLADDGAVVLVKRCPFLIHSYTLANDHERAFSRCMALTLTTVPLLNKEYTARFVRTMCTGDRQCEIKIEKKNPSEDKMGKSGGKK